MRVRSEGADGYDSLVVMGLLDREYQARVALGLEAYAVDLAGHGRQVGLDLVFK